MEPEKGSFVEPEKGSLELEKDSFVDYRPLLRARFSGSMLVCWRVSTFPASFAVPSGMMRWGPRQAREQVVGFSPARPQTCDVLQANIRSSHIP